MLFVGPFSPHPLRGSHEPCAALQAASTAARHRAGESPRGVRAGRGRAHLGLQLHPGQARRGQHASRLLRGAALSGGRRLPAAVLLEADAATGSPGLVHRHRRRRAAVRRVRAADHRIGIHDSRGLGIPHQPLRDHGAGLHRPGHGEMALVHGDRGRGGRGRGVRGPVPLRAPVLRLGRDLRRSWPPSSGRCTSSAWPTGPTGSARWPLSSCS